MKQFRVSFIACMQNHFESSALSAAPPVIVIIITWRFCNDDRIGARPVGIQRSVGMDAKVLAIDDSIFSNGSHGGTFSVSAITEVIPSHYRDQEASPKIPRNDRVRGPDYGNDTFARIATYYKNDIDTGLVFMPTPCSTDSRCRGEVN